MKKFFSAAILALACVSKCPVKMKKLLKIFCPFLLLSIASFAGWKGYNYYLCSAPKVNLGKAYDSYLEQCADEAQQYVKARDLNQKYCILVDYGLPSGTPRVFVWSFEKRKKVFSCHVMHGPGKGSTAKHPVFSNKPGSKCSALGHFEVTKEHGKKLTRSFRLRGLDVANRNAMRRGLMIHRSKWVDVNCWRKYIPLHEPSCQGCITVSSRGMTYIEKLVKGQKKDLLLWSFSSKK